MNLFDDTISFEEEQIFAPGRFKHSTVISGRRDNTLLAREGRQ
jgi:hypothetical protein